MTPKRTLTVRLSNDHLARLSQCDPVKAIEELVWNSLDAGATRVSVLINRNALLAVESVEIKDNGSGISTDLIDSAFGDLGISPKRKSPLNSRGKKVHGRLGEGRFRAYSLGARASWLTVSRGNKPLRIAGEIGSPTQFTIEEVAGNSGTPKIGTVFLAENLRQAEIKIPNDEALSAQLEAIFAPKLLSDAEVQITIGTNALNPKKHIELDETQGLQGHADAKVRAVIWKIGNHKDFFWCDKDFNVRESESSDIDSKVSLSVFLATNAISDAIDAGTFELRESSPAMKGLHESAIEAASLVVAKFLRSKTERIIDELKERKVYPYEFEPRSELERLERTAFDACATTIMSSLSSVAQAPKGAQLLTLSLMKEALETSPAAVKKVLQEVLRLPPQEMEELSNVLDRISLGNLIKMGKMVVDRLTFLAELEKISYDKELSKHVLERRHLHKFIELETWLFGEAYALGTSDESLNAVLKHHLSVLGIPSKEIELLASEGGTNKDIPDLVFGKQFRTGAGDHFEHLVIELKRPSVKIGSEEIAQIQRYATAINSDGRFDKNRTKWIYYVISSEVDADTEALYANQDSREPGQIIKKPNLEIYFKTWGQVIQSAKGRMNFLKDKLELKSSVQAGLPLIKSRHPKEVAEIERRADQDKDRRKTKTS